MWWRGIGFYRLKRGSLVEVLVANNGHAGLLPWVISSTHLPWEGGCCRAISYYFTCSGLAGKALDLQLFPTAFGCCACGGGGIIYCPLRGGMTALLISISWTAVLLSGSALSSSHTAMNSTSDLRRTKDDSVAPQSLSRYLLWIGSSRKAQTMPITSLKMTFTHGWMVTSLHP